MNLWLKIKIWTKVLAFTVVALYVLLFLYNNSDKRVQIWVWFKHTQDRNALLLVIIAFLTGVIGTLLTRTIFKTIRQIREATERGRSQKLEKAIAEMNAKAARLQTRDRVEPPRERAPEQTEPL